jgi:hypothetical protein
MTSVTLLTIACAVASLACCIRGFWIVRETRWLPITAALGWITLSRIGIGVPLQDFFEGEVVFSALAKERAAAAVLIFSLVLFVGQEAALRIMRKKSQVRELFHYDHRILFFVGAALWALAMIGHLYFLAKNIELLPMALTSFSNPDDHYGYRMYFGSLVYNAGRGQFSSYLSLFIFTPLALTLLAAAYRYSRIKAIIAMMAAISAIAPAVAVIHGQRSPLVALTVLSCATFALALSSQALSLLLARGRIVVLALGLAFLGFLSGSAVYAYTTKAGVGEAMLMMLNRIIIVPAATPNYIFELIPDQFDYRGIAGVFYMPDRFAETSDVSYGDLAVALTGVSFNVNSWAVAVGYSGLGFVGVLLVSLIIVALAVCLDKLLAGEPTVVRLASLILSIDAIQTLANEGLFYTVVLRGFFIFPLLVIASFRLARRPAPEAVSAPFTECAKVSAER